MPLSHAQKTKAATFIGFIQTGHWYSYGPAKTILGKSLILGERPSEDGWDAVNKERRAWRRYAPDHNPTYLIPEIPEGFNANELRRELKGDLVHLIKTWDPRLLIRKINGLNIPYTLLPWSDSAAQSVGQFAGQLIRGEIKSPMAELAILYRSVKGSQEEFLKRVKSDPSLRAAVHALAGASSQKEEREKPLDPSEFPKDWYIVQQSPMDDFRKAIYLILGELLVAGFQRYLHQCIQCSELYLSSRTGAQVGKFCGGKCSNAWYNQLKTKDKVAWAETTQFNRERAKKEIKQALSILHSFPKRNRMMKLRKKFPNKTEKQLGKLLEKSKVKLEV